MINAVSSFFPSTISRGTAPVKSSTDAPKTSLVIAATASAPVTPPASFADKLQSFFSLSPSEFSSVFSDDSGSSTLSGIFSHMVSAAYTQSNQLTARRLSLQA